MEMSSENHCCCEQEPDGTRKTMRSEEDRKKLVNRLNRIEGQIRGIRAMIEHDAYCNDVLTQSAAVSSAISAFNRELIAGHMHNCVVRDIREGKEDVVDELIATLNRLIK